MKKVIRVISGFVVELEDGSQALYADLNEEQKEQADQMINPPLCSCLDPAHPGDDPNCPVHYPGRHIK